MDGRKVVVVPEHVGQVNMVVNLMRTAGWIKDYEEPKAVPTLRKRAYPSKITQKMRDDFLAIIKPTGAIKPFTKDVNKVLRLIYNETRWIVPELLEILGYCASDWSIRERNIIDKKLRERFKKP